MMLALFSLLLELFVVLQWFVLFHFERKKRIIFYKIFFYKIFFFFYQMPNPETGKHKGFGFIEFEDPSAAQRINESNCDCWSTSTLLFAILHQH